MTICTHHHHHHFLILLEWFHVDCLKDAGEQLPAVGDRPARSKSRNSTGSNGSSTKKGADVYHCKACTATPVDDQSNASTVLQQRKRSNSITASGSPKKHSPRRPVTKAPQPPRATVSGRKAGVRKQEYEMDDGDEDDDDFQTASEHSSVTATVGSLEQYEREVIIAEGKTKGKRKSLYY